MSNINQNQPPLDPTSANNLSGIHTNTSGSLNLQRIRAADSRNVQFSEPTQQHNNHAEDLDQRKIQLREMTENLLQTFNNASMGVNTEKIGFDTDSSTISESGPLTEDELRAITELQIDPNEGVIKTSYHPFYSTSEFDILPRPTFNLDSLTPEERSEFLELQYLITRSKASPKEIRRFCQLEQRGIFPGMDPNFDHLIPNPQFNFDALSFLEQQDLIELESQNLSELSPAEIQKFRELERKTYDNSDKDVFITKIDDNKTQLITGNGLENGFKDINLFPDFADFDYLEKDK